jgi:hypothetical protein
MRATHADTLVSRRALLQGIATLLGGAALTGGDQLLAFSFDGPALDQAASTGTGMFTGADVALLDEIAETILPQTATPGAKAARTGAFMALMVTEAYTPQNQVIFREGMRQLDEACRAAANGASFMQATPAQRLALIEALDREQRTMTEERAEAPRSRAPAAVGPQDDQPRHYFRLMKELALLGFFTSEIGYTQAMRYIETPGRFDPCVPLAPGEKSWAPHA